MVKVNVKKRRKSKSKKILDLHSFLYDTLPKKYKKYNLVVIPYSRNKNPSHNTIKVVRDKGWVTIHLHYAFARIPNSKEFLSNIVTLEALKKNGKYLFYIRDEKDRGHSAVYDTEDKLKKRFEREISKRLRHL